MGVNIKSWKWRMGWRIIYLRVRNWVRLRLGRWRLWRYLNIECRWLNKKKLKVLNERRGFPYFKQSNCLRKIILTHCIANETFRCCVTWKLWKLWNSRS